MSEPTISYKNHRSVPFEPAVGRGNAVGAWHCRVLRNDTAVGRKFCAAYAKELRRKKPSRKDIWHLDEVVISIGGRKFGFGVPLTRTVKFSTRSSRSGAIPKLPSDCWSGC